MAFRFLTFYIWGSVTSLLLDSGIIFQGHTDRCTDIVTSGETPLIITITKKEDHRKRHLKLGTDNI